MMKKERIEGHTDIITAAGERANLKTSITMKERGPRTINTERNQE